MKKIFKFINSLPLIIIFALFLMSMTFNNTAILLSQSNPLLSTIFLSTGSSLILLEILVLLIFIFNIEKYENKECL